MINLENLTPSNLMIRTETVNQQLRLISSIIKVNLALTVDEAIKTSQQEPQQDFNHKLLLEEKHEFL